MGKDKEKELVDETSEESFPASDPPSWTAAPRPSAPPARRERSDAPKPQGDDGTRVRRWARQATNVPPDFYLWAGLGVAAASLGLLVGGRKHAGIATGLWVPSILLLGLWRKLEAGRAPEVASPSIH